jgi:hypothetical protein
MATVLAIALATVRRTGRDLRYERYLGFGVLGCVGYIAFMLFQDVRMYWTRWLADTAAHKHYLPIATGWHDLTHRWVVTGSWSDWSQEIAWMSLYFSVAVWVMVSLTHAPAYGARQVRAQRVSV